MRPISYDKNLLNPSISRIVVTLSVDEIYHEGLDRLCSPEELEYITLLSLRRVGYVLSHECSVAMNTYVFKALANDWEMDVSRQLDYLFFNVLPTRREVLMVKATTRHTINITLGDIF